jgi:hypothetical protein
MHLNISEARDVTDLGFERLATIKSLRSLRLRFAESQSVTVRSATALASLPVLQVLDVSYTRGLLTDAALHELLRTRSLRFLILAERGESQISSASMSAFAASAVKRVLITAQCGIVQNLGPSSAGREGLPAPFELFEDSSSADVYLPLFRDGIKAVDQRIALRGVGRAEAINVEAYMSNRETLQRIQDKGWVAIVDGIFLSGFESLDLAQKAAERINPLPLHRFLFRPNLDDEPCEFLISPSQGDIQWWQLGIQFRAENDITIGPGVWTSKNKAASAPGGKVDIELRAPGQRDGVPSLSLGHRAVGSGMLEQQLTIADKDALDLDLFRHAIPGAARCKSLDQDCRGVRVRVSVPELSIDQVVVAFVLSTAPAPTR